VKEELSDMSSRSQQELFEVAHQLADHAMLRCREFQNRGAPAEKKADKTWVTQADLAIEKELREMISKLTPEIPVLGEEEGGNPLEEDSGLTWVLDPIDGTFSFVHGLPFYSSLLSLCQGKKPIVGIACLPEMQIKMSAQRGGGLFLNEEKWEYSRHHANENIEIVATADPYRFFMEQKNPVVETLYGPGFKSRTYPDALGYYLLLKGHVRAFVDPKVEVWDVAPFHILLPEAGFAIHPWAEPNAGLRRGTSVAYRCDASGSPHRVEDVLKVLGKC
jgi:fructose-1,6-bisphosphatase/inositol monophosphatase family enzyme